MPTSAPNSAPADTLGSVAPTLQVSQNSGGVALTRADVEAAFAFFDVQNKKELKPRDLKMRLSAFYPNMTSREYKFLLDEGNGGPFTVDTLWNIIDGFNAMRAPASAAGLDNLHFEPVREAFRIYDPQGCGVMDVDVLTDVMKRIGLGDLSQEEMALLINTADFDKDGKINLEDFRSLLNISR
ncbi:EF hand domain [Trypanosoma vivax]|uniref:EF-hand domain-containing protein n=1 Tax=Trypanosoma vivax (strain Y486) TaxID=1055687 RepID=G0TUL2_TRYVY|nr:hypothetical protein TRVL_03975 [Trypanosoma vivax]KAH8606903.1 EF hand domain [Trypanosoma vivax]CCC47647.1 conserved hypothetical protein [Trypanosoma vivax Y486]